MFLNPTEVVGLMPLRASDKVADFGCGTGEYAALIQNKLAAEGMLFAFDLFSPHVEALHRRCVVDGKGNTFPVCVDLDERIPLKDNLLDTSIVANTLHALKNRPVFLSELYRVTRPKGKVLVVDWASSFKNIGPSVEAVIAPGDAVRLVKAHGFSVGDMLPAGTHHYAFIATKQ